MSDAATDNDSQAVAGEVVDPEGAGAWQPAATAHVALGIGSKTLYRRIERGQIRSRRNEFGRIEVWVPADNRESTQSPPVTMAPIRPDSQSLSVAVIDELRRQHQATLEVVTRQAETIGQLRAELAALRASQRPTASNLTAEPSEPIREPSTPGEPVSAPWWRRWLAAVYG
jgi:hypothetical protein